MKNKISSILCGVAALILIGFIVYHLKEDKPLVVSKSQLKVESNTIDSLRIDSAEKNIDKAVIRIKKKKLKKVELHEKYKTDSVAIDTSEFETLVRLFSAKYPTHPSN